MPRTGLYGVIDWLRQRALADVPCSELLDRFRAARDSRDALACEPMAEAAFAELVRRHGPKVYAVCRRILGDHQLAEDAFQAVFVILSRKAATIRPASAVGGFLYGVARKAALEAAAVNRRRKENLMSRVPDAAATESSVSHADVLALLDEEIANLSDKYRAAVVLCELDGVSRANAAKQLGISEGTLSSRLAAARKQLAHRLAKRGASLSAGLLAALAESARAAVPPGLVAAAAQTTATVLSPAVALIVQGVLRTMILMKLKSVTMLAAAMVLFSGLGLGLSTGDDGLPEVKPKAPAADEKKAAAPALPATAVDEPKARTDVHGDPLPKGVLARLGTLRQRAAKSHVAVSADGKEIITVGGDMTVRVWDLATGNLRSLKQLPDARSHDNKTFLSPHGKYLLRQSYDRPPGNQIVVWDVAEGKIAYSHPLVYNAYIDAAAFSANQSQVALAGRTESPADQFIRVWDLQSGKMRTLHENNKDTASYSFDGVVQFSPDGKNLVAIQRDSTMRCWKLDTDKLAWETRSFSPFFCFSPDSKTVVRRDATPLDVATGTPTPWKVKLPIDCIPITYSPTGRQLALLHGKDGLLIWDTATGNTVLRVPIADDWDYLSIELRPPTDFAFTPDGTGIIWNSDGIQRWNLADGKAVFPKTREWGHTGSVLRIVFSPDGKQLASAGRIDRMLLWDIAAARPLFVPQGGGGWIMAFTSTGTEFLAPYSGKIGGLGMWNANTGKLVDVFEWPNKKEGFHDEFRVTSDGRKIMTITARAGGGLDEGMLTTWDFASRKVDRQEPVPWGTSSVLTSDGHRVLMYDARTGNVQLRTRDDAEPRWRILMDDTGSQLNDCRLAVSPDENLMVASRPTRRSGGRLLDVRIGHMVTGQELMKLDVDHWSLFAFSPDNRLFAVAMAEGMRFWEIASHKQVGFIPAPNRNAIPLGESFASALAFSPDSRTLATGHIDTTILLWDATFQDGAKHGPLSDAEREAFWADLAGADAVRAQAALWRLVGDPKASVAFLRPRLSAATAAPAQVVAPLVRDLDSNDFKRRAAADKELRRLGDRAEPALRRALKADMSLEAKRRVESLLAAAEPALPATNNRLRLVRSVHVLEQIASAESRQLLAEISQGEYPSWLARAAGEAAKRMKTPSADESK